MDSDSSESGENEDNQNNQNRQFNKVKTEMIEKCVTEVLKLIKKALIKETKCRKEHIKTIRKNTKKPKPNEKVVANQIQRLCNEIKAIAYTPANPAAEVPQPSRYCDVVAGTSRTKTEQTPGKLSMETIESGSSRISSNRFDTTKSVTSQGNTELVVLGNVRNRAEEHKSLVSRSIEDSKTSLKGITASSGVPGSFIERDPGPSRSNLPPRIPESLRSMEISKASMNHSNVVESGTLRQIETVALEISDSPSKIQLVFSKSTVVSAPKTSEIPAKETSNSHTVTHIGTAGSNPKELFGIFGNRSKVGSPRSCFVTEVCEAPASSSNAEVTNNSRNMETVVSEISSAFTNKIPRATKSPSQTTLKALKNCTETGNTVTTDSCTKPVKEASKTHHGTDGSCIQATPSTPETLVEAATGPSRSLSKIRDPESSRINKEKEVSGAPVSSSNAAATNTSRNMEAVVSLISSANKIPGAIKSPAQTTLKASKTCTEIGITVTSDSCTKPVKEASKTHHGADRSCIQATPSTPETLIDAATGSSRSLSKTKEPESSRRNKEKEVSEAPASSSDTAITYTSRNMKTVVPETSSDSSNTIPVTTKSHTQTTPEPSKNYAKTVVTETFESSTKHVKEALKMHHGTSGSCIQATPGTPETIAEADTTASSNLSKTKDPESSRRNTETEASEITTSRLDVAECGNLRHTNTITPDTSSCRTNAIPATSKKDSNAVANESSSNKTDATSIGMSGNVNTVVLNDLLNKRYENIAHKESNNSQICTKTKVNISGSDEINNNNTIKRKTEANLKRNLTISNNEDPKRAKLEHKCTLCGIVINNEDYAKHYEERHGMHHEIKHNNENYEHKIQDLNKRLQNPTDTTKSNNEQKDIITAESKKRTEARSFSAPNESTVANTIAGINVDSDKVKEPAEKKKRTATRSDSTPNENIGKTNATTLKSESNRNTALEDFIVDLTDDSNLDETKPPTNVRVNKCSPKPVDDYQVLNDHQFVDLSDDTSLYDIPKEEEIKSAEALLLENVKEEQATICQDVELVRNDLPTLSNNIKSQKRHKTTEHSTDETKQKLAHRESLQKRNDCRDIVPETSRRRSLINITKYQETDKKHTKVTKPKTSNNPTKLSRTEVGFGTSRNHTELMSGTSVSVPRFETIESSKRQSKEPPVSINQHLTLTKQQKKHGSSKRRKHKSKSPYEKPNQTFSNTNRISSATIATKTSVNAPKVAMINATTTQRIQKTNDHISGKNIFSTGNITTRVKPEVRISAKILKTNDSSIQHTGKTKPNWAQKHTIKSKNTSGLKTDSLAGLAIKTIDAPKESLPNSTSVSVSLPSSTTITPIQATQKANHTSASNSINAKGVSHTMSVPPTTSPNIISTSNIVKSAIQKQSMLQKFYSVMANFPPGLTNIASQKRNSVTQNTTRISSSASVSPAGHQNKPSVSPQSNHQTSSLIKSNHRQPGSSNTQNVTGNIKPAPSTNVQAPKQHSNTTARTNKSDFQITSNTTRRKSVPASEHSDRKKTNTSVNLQSPQIEWYSPISLGDQNAKLSNVASRNANRRASVNLNDAHPQKYSWHTPVEPDNDRPETSSTASKSITLNNLSLSFSDPVEIRHQRPNNQRIADARQPSYSEVGWQNLLTPRRQSTLLRDQGLRLPQTGRTWHTPVKSPTQN